MKGRSLDEITNRLVICLAAQWTFTLPLIYLCDLGPYKDSKNGT